MQPQPPPGTVLPLSPAPPLSRPDAQTRSSSCPVLGVGVGEAAILFLESHTPEPSVPVFSLEEASLDRSTQGP